MNRRDFIKTTMVAAGGLMLGHFYGNAYAGEKGKMEYVTLNNGVTMPILGYGTLNLPFSECASCVAEAIKTGFRLIDTAKNYINEEYVGQGIKQSGIDRKELFITSKLWLKDASYEKAKKAFQLTLERLQIEYLDLYLIHQPFGDIYGAWRAMEELYQGGKIRAIGVSNFLDDRLVDFIMANQIKPAVNQIEVNPYCQQWKAQEVNKEYGVQIEAWGPLGQMKRPELIQNPILVNIALQHNKTVPQVILRWLTQRGIVAVVKSSKIEHMREDFNIFDFSLSDADMEQIRGLDTGKSIFGDHRDPARVKWFHNSATRERK